MAELDMQTKSEHLQQLSRPTESGRKQLKQNNGSESSSVKPARGRLFGSIVGAVRMIGRAGDVWRCVVRNDCAQFACSLCVINLLRRQPLGQPTPLNPSHSNSAPRMRRVLTVLYGNNSSVRSASSASSPSIGHQLAHELVGFNWNRCGSQFARQRAEFIGSLWQLAAWSSLSCATCARLCPA